MFQENEFVSLESNRILLDITLKCFKFLKIIFFKNNKLIS